MTSQRYDLSTYFCSRCSSVAFCLFSRFHMSSSFCIESRSSCTKSMILPSGLTLRVRVWMLPRSLSISRCTSSLSFLRAMSFTWGRSCKQRHIAWSQCTQPLLSPSWHLSSGVRLVVVNNVFVFVFSFLTFSSLCYVLTISNCYSLPPQTTCKVT